MMNRRHHHHNIQPYDYDRFAPRERDQARAIEYQDDSLSSINSDEDSYLHRSHSKDKKSNFFTQKSESSKTKEKTNSDAYYQKELPKNQQTDTSTDSATTERLGRLEAMLEELIKRNNNPQPSTSSKLEKNEKRDGQFFLDPRKHSFTTSMWINKIQEVSNQNNWSEKSTIQYMSTQMSGIIKAWYNSLPNYDYTWPELKILITKIFPDNTEFVTTLKRLVTRIRQPDETITTYYFSKMYLIEACKINGEDAVSCLIDGLNNQSIQEQAKAQNYLTPESLYSQFLMQLPDYTVDYSVSVPPETMLNDWYYNDQEQNIERIERIERLERTNESVQQSQEEFVEYQKEERNEEEFDYRNQGNHGFHEERSFKSPPKRPGPVHSRLDKRFIRPNQFRNFNKMPMAAKVCSICHKRGHLAKHCRNAVMLCTLLGESSHNNWFNVDCTVNGHNLDAFIDTGCSSVILRNKEACMLNLKVDPTSDVVRVYGGGLVRALGRVDIELAVDSVRAQVKAVVVPDNLQDVSVIVGQSFLMQKNVSLVVRNATLCVVEA